VNFFCGLINDHQVQNCEGKLSGNHPKIYITLLSGTSGIDHASFYQLFSLNICSQDSQDNMYSGQTKACYLHCRITSISSSRSILLISSWSSTTSRLMSDFKRDAYKDTYAFRSRAFLNNCSQVRLPLHT